jgi:NADPH:quinone reductase-like Zn-dependent oxidoreductase
MVGVVHEVGDGVTGWMVGDAVFAGVNGTSRGPPHGSVQNRLGGGRRRYV